MRRTSYIFVYSLRACQHNRTSSFYPC